MVQAFIKIIKLISRKCAPDMGNEQSSRYDAMCRGLDRIWDEAVCIFNELDLCLTSFKFVALDRKEA